MLSPVPSLPRVSQEISLYLSYLSSLSPSVRLRNVQIDTGRKSIPWPLDFFLFDQDAFVCVMVNEAALVPNDDGDGDDACVLYSVLYCTV